MSLASTVSWEVGKASLNNGPEIPFLASLSDVSSAVEALLTSLGVQSVDVGAPLPCWGLLGSRRFTMGGQRFAGSGGSRQAALAMAARIASKRRRYCHS